MDAVSGKTPDTPDIPDRSPPSYAESQRQVWAGVRTVEEVGNAVYKSLKEQDFSNSFIKAVLESAISELPEGTVSYTSDTVKKSTFNNLVEQLKEKIGDFDFEQIARKSSSNISDFNLENSLAEIDSVLTPNEIVHFARTFLEPRDFQRYKGESQLGQIVITILVTRHCNMSVNEFLTRLNPEFCDIASLSLSENT